MKNYYDDWHGLREKGNTHRKTGQRDIKLDGLNQEFIAQIEHLAHGIQKRVEPFEFMQIPFPSGQTQIPPQAIAEDGLYEGREDLLELLDAASERQGKKDIVAPCMNMPGLGLPTYLCTINESS